jgi:hypothetical protein
MSGSMVLRDNKGLGSISILEDEQTVATLNKCYACVVSQSEASTITEEHILPKIIGGRKTLPILCEHHNSYGGEKIDIGFIEAFQVFRVYLGLVPFSKDKPKRWNALPIKLSDTEKEFLMNSSGDVFLSNPEFEKKDLGNGKLQIKMKVSSEKEKNLLLKQLKKSYPKMEYADFIPEDNFNNPSAQLMMQVQLSGEPLKRAIAKVAIGFAVAMGICPEDLRPIISYCFLNQQGQFVSHLHDYLTSQIQMGSFNHTIVLNGNPESGLLVSFIEFFGCAPFIVLLSNTYAGEEFCTTYTIDPTKNIHETATSKVNLTKDQFYELFKHDDLVPNGFIDCFKTGLAAAMYRQKRCREISNVVDQAISHFNFNGKDLDHKNIMAISEYVLTHYIIPMIKRPKPLVDNEIFEKY